MHLQLFLLWAYQIWCFSLYAHFEPIFFLECHCFLKNGWFFVSPFPAHFFFAPHLPYKPSYRRKERKHVSNWYLLSRSCIIFSLKSSIYALKSGLTQNVRCYICYFYNHMWIRLIRKMGSKKKSGGQKKRTLFQKPKKWGISKKIKGRKMRG